MVAVLDSHAAVDANGLPVHPARVPASQERHRTCNIVGGAQTVLRMQRRKELGVAVIHSGVERLGINRARRDCVDGDSAAAKLLVLGQHACHLLQGSLGHAVQEMAALDHAQRGQRGRYGDDAAGRVGGIGLFMSRGVGGLGEVGLSDLGKEGGTHDVDRSGLLVRLFGHLVDRLVDQPAGVQDHDVEAAKLLDRSVEQAAAFFQVADAALDGDGANGFFSGLGASGGGDMSGDFVDDLLGLELVRDIVYDNVEAILGQAEGDGAADSAGGSSDDSNATRSSHFCLFDWLVEVGFVVNGLK